MSNSLAAVHPELIAEWSDRNLPLTPDSVTFGSNKKVSWLWSDRTFGGFFGSRLFNLPQFLLQLLHFLYPSNHDLH